VIVYNTETEKYDWHTIRGTRSDARALERKTFEEVAHLFLDDRHANNRRLSTLEEYQTELKLSLLPQPDPKLPPLGPRDIRNIKRSDMKTSEVSLDAQKPYFRMVRTWCSKGFRFYAPKTEAGRRSIPISASFVLREHRDRSGGAGTSAESARARSIHRRPARDLSTRPRTKLSSPSVAATGRWSVYGRRDFPVRSVSRDTTSISFPRIASMGGICRMSKLLSCMSGSNP
jgi:hypothetical protein